MAKKKKKCYQKLSDKILNQIKQTVKDFKPNHQNNNLKNTFFNFFILLVIITKWPNNFYLCSHKTLHQNPISLPKNKKQKNKKKNTSIVFKVTLNRVGSAPLPTYTSPSTDTCSYRISILGISIPTLPLKPNSKILIHTKTKTKSKTNKKKTTCQFCL